MNKLLLIGFSLLVGISIAGIVWYCWGLIENIRTSLHNKKVPLPATEAEEDANSTEAQEA